MTGSARLDDLADRDLVLEAVVEELSVKQALFATLEPLEEALIEDPIQVMFNGGVSTMRTLAGQLAAIAVARSLARIPCELTSGERAALVGPGSRVLLYTGWRHATGLRAPRSGIGFALAGASVVRWWVTRRRATSLPPTRRSRSSGS